MNSDEPLHIVHEDYEHYQDRVKKEQWLASQTRTILCIIVLVLFGIITFSIPFWKT